MKISRFAFVFGVALAVNAPLWAQKAPVKSTGKAQSQRQSASQYWASQVLHPSFLLSSPRERVDGGSAFLFSHPRTGQTLLGTAVHLFGPACGMQAQLSFAQIWARNPQVAASNRSGTLGVKASGIATKNGLAMSDEDDQTALYDFIAFGVSGKPKARPFRLAARDPKVGEWVWILGRVTIPARVLGTDAGGFNLQHAFAARTSGYSGGPIINAKGEIVGSLVGGFDTSTVACPVSQMRALLR